VIKRKTPEPQAIQNPEAIEVQPIDEKVSAVNPDEPEQVSATPPKNSKKTSQKEKQKKTKTKNKN